MALIVPTRRGFLAGLAAVLATPAVVRAEVLMPVRSIERFALAPFGWESFDRAPLGTAYQWCAKTIMGEPNNQFRDAMDNGWRPVPAGRYNSQFAINGDQIEIGGCVLMERPMRMASAAREKEIAQARGLVDQWEQQIRAQGFDVSVRYANGPVEFHTIRFPE